MAAAALNTTNNLWTILSSNKLSVWLDDQNNRNSISIVLFNEFETLKSISPINLEMFDIGISQISLRDTGLYIDFECYQNYSKIKDIHLSFHSDGGKDGTSPCHIKLDRLSGNMIDLEFQYNQHDPIPFKMNIRSSDDDITGILHRKLKREELRFVDVYRQLLNIINTMTQKMFNHIIQFSTPDIITPLAITGIFQEGSLGLERKASDLPVKGSSLELIFTIDTPLTLMSIVKSRLHFTREELEKLRVKLNNLKKQREINSETNIDNIDSLKSKVDRRLDFILNKGDPIHAPAKLESMTAINLLGKTFSNIDNYRKNFRIMYDKAESVKREFDILIEEYRILKDKVDEDERLYGRSRRRETGNPYGRRHKEKYLKYKQKYLQLKKLLQEQNLI